MIQVLLTIDKYKGLPFLQISPQMFQERNVAEILKIAKTTLDNGLS